MVFPLLIAAAAANAAGKIRSGKAAKNQGQYNAALSDRDAAVARDQAAAQVIRQKRVAQKTLGSMRAAYGAAGVTVEGSPLDVLEESAAQAELDSLTLKYQGELKAIGAESSAELSRYLGDEAEKAGYVSAAGSILQSFGNSYGSTGGTS